MAIRHCPSALSYSPPPSEQDRQMFQPMSGPWPAPPCHRSRQRLSGLLPHPTRPRSQVLAPLPDARSAA